MEQLIERCQEKLRVIDRLTDLENNVPSDKELRQAYNFDFLINWIDQRESQNKSELFALQQNSIRMKKLCEKHGSSRSLSVTLTADCSPINTADCSPIDKAEISFS